MRVINQSLLERVVRVIFPNHNVIVNARKEAQVVNPLSNHFFEVDLFIKEFNLGFEFQDDYHYITKWYYHRPKSLIASRDHIKKEKIIASGLTLIQVPCWWDGEDLSLIGSIVFERPDLQDNFLLSSLSLPISLNPPDKFFSEWTIPGVGELMSPSFSTSILSISDQVKNWWLGEKYDGVRVCWNPDQMVLYSRLGNQIDLPSPFYDKMPSVYLDSEIWLGRGCFAETAAIYSSEELVNFAFLKIVAFDNPNIELHKKKFEKRYASLLHSISSSHPFAIIAMRFLCPSNKVLQDHLEYIMDDGGEGVILRKPHSVYIRGRSDLLWKIKTQREDTEALVVSVEDDSTYLLQLPNGSTFYAPKLKDSTIQPKRGDVVTFFYDNFTQHSLPSNPSIFRIRADLNWDDVLQQHEKEGDKSAIGFSTKPKGYWTTTSDKEEDESRKLEVIKEKEGGREKRENREKGKLNMRKFLESFAKDNQHDPLIAETWYLLADELRKQKEMRALVSEYGSYIKALVNLFPEIEFQDYQFSSLPKNYWTDVRNRHKYLLQFASKKNLDPLLPEAWYSISLDEVLREKEIASIISYYNYNFGKTLIHLFPNIGLEKEKLSNLSGNPYNIKYQRQIFLNYANMKGFDSLVADNWYNVNFETMRPFVDTRFIERIYQGKFATAVMTFFPTIGLSKEKFNRKVKVFSLDQQRQFFDDYAKEKGFDPLLPENWYPVDINSVLSTKNGYTILALYNKSLANALTHVYPEMKFIHAAFGKRQKDHQAAFNDFANSHGFDPLSPEAWYPVSKSMLLSHLGTKKVLGYYKEDIVQALSAVYPHITFFPEKFGSRKKQYWANPSARKEFFDTIGTSLSINHQAPNDWYSVYSRIRPLVSSHKDGVSVLKYHNMSITQALMDLYPNIGLKKEKLK